MLAYTGWTGHAVLEVLIGMRPMDRREVYATRREHDPYALFADLVAMNGAARWFETVFAGSLLGDPVAVLGVYERTPHVGSAVMIATPALTPRMAAELARRAREVVIPNLIGQGLARVDCQCLDEHKAAQTFLRHCGAQAAATPRRAIGKRGETFREFYWLADELVARAPREERACA